MSHNFFLDVVIIVFIQSVLLLIYLLFNRKFKRKNDPLHEKLNVLNAILSSTKHDKILQLDKIKELELGSSEVFVFSKDLYRDVQNSGQFSKDMHNVGTFYQTVKQNIAENSARYTYFLKQDSHLKHFLHSFDEAYKDIDTLHDKVSFYIIPSEKYFFYDEIYLYKSADGEYTAYEFLPSISDEEQQVLFFLELDEKQVIRLISIKDSLIENYPHQDINMLVQDGN